MKLLSSNFSPFSTRVRMLIAIKGLDIDIVNPEPPLRTEAFRKQFPLAKIPVLILDDGTHLAESWSIMEYLEAAFPTHPLTPDTPLGKAHASMMCRYADLHLGPALFPLFSLLLSKTEIEAESLSDKVSHLSHALAQGERMFVQMKQQSESDMRTLHIGDIALACSFYFALATPKQLGVNDILAPYSELQTWWQWVQSNEVIASGVKEMDCALMQFVNQQ
ncbi:glutathione S-transferase family protein [Thalassotalea mangrovi]|uniref:Glutathione S-transferase family protein n=1 Tax=Thalassotalea mangrovi TaxID=2572245 RepID=A0A4U1B6G5_9GAMM|nr:glutathione S-transferase family protein [Thalassotalea mangrovi]TKB46038.1 glutathione S-transferase family protein [Thalassotalea mangrovi]